MRGGSLINLMLAALFLTLVTVLPAAAAPLEELTPYFSPRYFTWEEFSGGRRLLKETGALYAAGVQLGFALPSATPSTVVFRGRGELFGGVIDYDGETQAPNPVPVKTEVNYFGTQFDVNAAYRYSGTGWNLEPGLGLGYRLWLRDLQDSTTATGLPVSGYGETWDTVYLKLGSRGQLRTDSGWSFSAEGGAKYPLYTGNSVDFVNFGKATFHPVGHWSGYAEAGARYRRFTVSLSYDGFRFGASPVVQVGLQRFLQPKSSSDIFGVNLGWAFR